MQLDLSSIWTPSFWGQGQEGGLHPGLVEPLQVLPRKHRIGMGFQDFQGEDLLLRCLLHILCYVIIWAKFLRDVLSIPKRKKCVRNVHHDRHFPIDGSQPFGNLERESEQGISTSSHEPILFKHVSISNTPICTNSNYSGLLPTLPHSSKAPHSTSVTLLPPMMTAL